MASENRMRRLGLIGIGFVVVLSAVVWVYALFISDAKPIDSLDDPAFAKAAQPICAASVQSLKDAGVVDKVASSPAERADLAARADAILSAMVDQLGQHVPAGAEDARIVTAWLGDWRAWLEDRTTWEADLLAGKDGPFNERQRKTGEPNSQQLDVLARTNNMPDCAIPSGI